MENKTTITRKASFKFDLFLNWKPWVYFVSGLVLGMMTHCSVTIN
jgi:hypothetical protein